MVTLYLVRHAIAFERDPMRWPDDGERPLTDNGEAKFQRGAAGLRTIAGTVDVVLSSPLVRAWQTALILRDAAGWPDPTRFDPLQPAMGAGAVVAALGDYADADALALVGHEPDLTALASYLLTGMGGEMRLEMKKGGAACLRCDGGVAPGAATLVWWATPKMLRSLGH
jgi:phosphohistidine phosphatase